MSTITFDTLRYAERLEQAGVSREQSRAFAEAQRDSLGNAELTTRQDLREMELRLYHQRGLRNQQSCDPFDHVGF